MIYLERTVTIKNGTASIDEQIVLYKGDKNVEARFILKDNPFKQKAGITLTYAQLVIDREADPIFSDIENLSNSKVLFTITGEMIDELIECGEYNFQIRLYDETQTSRATLPPVEAGILIKTPICEEEGVNYSIANSSKAATGETLDAFDDEGNYNKTAWVHGDLITDSKLNKIEDALYEINEKTDIDLSDYALKTDIPTNVSAFANDAEYLIEGDLDSYATKDYVDKTVSKEIDLSDYALKTDLPIIPTNVSAFVNDIGYLTEHQSLEDYATKVYVDDAISNIEIEGGGNIDLSDYALKSEIPSVEGLASVTYVDSEVAKKADINHEHERYLTEENLSEYALRTELDNYALRAEIPSLEGYATEEYVNNSQAQNQQYVDSVIGDINTILDAINGEEV